MNVQMNEWMNEWMNDEQFLVCCCWQQRQQLWLQHPCLEPGLSGQPETLKNERWKEGMNEQMNEWMNERMNEWWTIPCLLLLTINATALAATYMYLSWTRSVRPASQRPWRMKEGRNELMNEWMNEGTRVGWNVHRLTMSWLWCNGQIWPNMVYFSTLSPLRSTHFFHQCCSAWMPVVNSSHPDPQKSPELQITSSWSVQYCFPAKCFFMLGNRK